MANHVCSIVPPYLLEAMAQSQDTGARQLATQTLSLTRQLQNGRRELFAAQLAPGYCHQDEPNAVHSQTIVPDYLLEDISKAEDINEGVKESAAKSLALSRQIRDERQTTLASEASAVKGDTIVGFWRGVYDVKNQGDSDSGNIYPFLPGEPARLEGQSENPDKSVNQAFDNCLEVLEFYKNIFNRNSIDNKNIHVISSVHCGKKFGNAFWSPDKLQMIYGDGDDFLYNFTGCIDVIGHEMTHGVTQYTSHLQYRGESGALNEHISDAFGIMVKQMVEKTTANTSDWLIGEGCLMPDIKGVALRNMRNPGTAYDDKRLGKDPQPDNYNSIPVSVKESDQNDPRTDYGGVHLMSGVPNRAFVICALAFGSYTWEKAGKIWWKTVTSHQISANCTFIQFADVTVEMAKELFGDSDAKTVRKAWIDVGVVRHI